MALGDTFSDNGDGTDLRELEHFQSAFEYGALTGEVDYGVDLWEFLSGVSEILVHGDKDLLGVPVEFLEVVTGEGVNHGGHARLRAAS